MFDDIHLSFDNVPVDTPIIFIIPLTHAINDHPLVKKAVQYGFRHPVISTHIGNEKLNTPHLCLFNKYDHHYGKKKIDDKKIGFSLIYTIKNYFKIERKGDSCSIFVNFSENALNYLHDYTKKHKFKFSAIEEQREISGKFVVEPLSEKSVIVEVIEEATDLGDREKADYDLTVASFHTHPLEAYQKYSVCLAYPSTDDYITILHVHANHYGMFHITATIEGIYIITVKTKESQEKILKNFDAHTKYIEKNYSIDYPECDKEHIDKDTKKRQRQIKDYINRVNRFKLFTVLFKSWKEAKEPIRISYNPFVNNQCILSDEQINFHKIVKDSVERKLKQK